MSPEEGTMARPLRLEFPGALYHVTSRGNGRQRIFLDSGDNLKFLDLLGRTVERFRWVCVAFCLMENHYHLMIETPEANLSQGMHHLNTSFCLAHNKRHDRVGHLFQGRFKSIVVDRDSYLLELARYVVLNPVRAGLADRPEDWPWSSYRLTAGLPVPAAFAEAASFLAVTPLLDLFDGDRRRYRDFVADGIGRESPWDKVHAQLFLGSAAFVADVRQKLPERRDDREIPKEQRYARRPPLAEIFAGCRTKGERDAAIAAAYRDHGYGQKEIAAFLGIHYTTVCHALKRHGSKR